MILSIVIFIFILGLLVFAHELGHFLAAKRQGVKVEEFGFGFPPRLFGVQRGETVYSINLIPLGGFVRLFGEAAGKPDGFPADERSEATEEPDGVTGRSEGQLEESADRRSFAFRPLAERALIVAAGVAGNVVLAWLLFSFAHALGTPTLLEDAEDSDDIRVVITEVRAGSPAGEVGLLPGDVILKLADAKGAVLEPVGTIAAVQAFITRHQGDELVVTFRRRGTSHELRATPRRNPPVGEGALGIAMVRVGIRQYPWYQAMVQGVATLFFLGREIVVGVAALLWGLVSDGRLIAEVAGPVGIAVLSREALLLGFAELVFFAGVLSLNLAVINLLPFPALDGGRLLFLAIERLKGSPVSQRAERLAHTAGFAFLMALMVLVTYRDILRML